MLVAMFAEEWGQRLAAAREEQLRVRHVNIYFMPHEECSCPDCVEETEWPAKKRRLYLGDEVHIGCSAENVKSAIYVRESHAGQMQSNVTYIWWSFLSA